MATPPFDPASIPPGTVIAGKYELGPAIGVGDHSVVYSALHRLLQRKAAVKILGATDPAGVRRFAREARLASAIEHPNVVEVYEVGLLPDGRPFLATEYLEGETVGQRLARQGPFAVPAALTLCQEVLAGLAAAHEKSIVHRDLRPPNLFLARIRGEEVLKILDFGVSREYGANDSTLTAPGTLLGSAGYLAPEQLYEDGLIDHRVDLYAAGVLLYELLTGRVPFTAKGPTLLVDIVERTPDPPSHWRAGIPKDVDRVVLSALSKRAEDRFADADDMAEALRLAALFAQYMGS